jgi:competence protein CoiA
MKIALVDGCRHEAEPGLSGKCQGCGSVMMPKCGERRVWHWAHRGEQHCDRWWEPETEWHRNWENRFPADWQEVIHRADNGEKHVADVKTAQGLVIEFQHSYLKPDERRAREAFYSPLIWVVDGLRRKRDKPSFEKSRGHVVWPAPLTIRTATEQCTLLQEWIDSCVPVFFDFGIIQEDIASFGVPVLWGLDPKSADRIALLSPVPLEKFIESLRNGEPIKGISSKAARRRVRTSTIPSWRPIHPASGFAGYLAHKNRKPRRF